MRKKIMGAVVAALVMVGVVLPQAAAASDPAMVAARQHIFGTGNVDARTGAVRSDRVILSWLTVATFAAAIRGHVVLLDTYLHKRESTPNYVPSTLDELVALRPEFIFIGHGHFDHAATAGEVAVRTGATVISTAENCAQVRAQAQAYAGPGSEIACLAAIAAAAAPGTKASFDNLIPSVCVTAVKHVHSAAEPPDLTRDITNVAVPLPDLGLLLLHPPGPTVVNGLTTDGDEGGSVLYQFQVGQFSLVWHDSSGPLKEVAPWVFDVLRGLPPTDVEVGAILGFNFATNGLRDSAIYAAAFNPKVFIPNHHDFVTEYGSAADYQPTMRRELAWYGVNPELRWLSDPLDYVRPELMTFDINDPRWKDLAISSAKSCAN